MSNPIQSILRKLGPRDIERLQGLGQSLGMSETNRDDARMTPIARGGDLPLSFAQQRLWFLAQLEDVSATYHIPLALRLRGRLRGEALRGALDRLLARHEGLRTVFVANDGEPSARLLPPHTRVPWLEHDLRACEDAQARLRDIATQELHTPFDLECGPLIRARLIRLDEEEHELLITQHHIVSDGWSIAVLARELGALYGSFERADQQPASDPLPPLTVHYPDYAAWQRRWLSGARLESQIEYWRDALSGAPALLDLPTDRPRPPRQSFAAAYLDLRLDAQTTQALKRLSQRHGATLFMTTMTAWAAVLARLSGQTDLVIGTPNANRNRAEIQSLIGFFVNTLALRVDASGDPSLAELLGRVRAVALAAQDHQDLPFERVVEVLQPPRRLDHTPLFQVLFAWQNNDAGVFELDGLRADPPRMSIDTLKFDLELHMSECGDGIEGRLYYSTALFDAATIERQVGYFTTMLRAMIDDDSQPAAAVDLLAPAERRLLLEDFNRCDAPTPPELCVHRLFERQARATPDATALVHSRRSLSYAELNAMANRLARALIARGVTPGDLVGLCVERGVPMIAALLAILKAGAAYLPLDPDYPRERLRRILDEAGVTLLLDDAAGRDALGGASMPVATLDLDAFDWNAVVEDENDPDAQALGLTPDHLAYVIYTSGSTGTPKGVAMPHRPLLNLLHWQNANLPPAQTTLQFAALGFDVAFQEIFGALSAGAALVLIDAPLRVDFPRLLRELGEQRIERLHLPYIALQSLAEAAGDCDPADIDALRGHLREVIVAGEQLRITPQIRRLFRRLPECRLHNHYGPTESHVVTSHTLDGDADAWPDHAPIGRPIAHSRLYLLDPRGQPVPLGATGELHIGGAGLAQGYWRRPDLSAERFLADPHSPQAGARRYRSGDLARYRADGTLVFLGRNDHQIKIRGFRVEPGEIEARLSEHPAVTETVVIAREDRPGDRRLVAYFIAATHAAAHADTVAALRAHLSARLPEHMLPSAFVAVPGFALTPNGKLDRAALPAPDDGDLARSPFEPPREGGERRLAALWRELLDVERIGRDDHFFEIGGHSLLAAQLAARIGKARGREIAVRELFARPSLRDMAELLRESPSTRPMLDLDAEIQLDPEIRALPPRAATTPPRHLLLTGATGFLGAFLLAELLRKTDAEVHCLIRCDDAAQGWRRLHDTLAGFGLNEHCDRARIVVVPGDLAQPLLGLDEAAFDRLAGTVEVIYHNGAWVNSLHGYPTLKAANVLGTQEVMRLASRAMPKHIHYVSSIGTLPPWTPELAGVDDEESLFAHWRGLSTGYAQSKWVAEQLLRLGGRRGLGYTVYRPTHISGASLSAVSNDSDTWSLFIDACLRHRRVPRLDERLNWLPVDRMSEYIVELSLRGDLAGRSLNLLHPRSFAVQALTEAIAASDGAPVTSLPYREWLALCATDPATRNIASILPADLADEPSAASAFGPVRVGNAVDTLLGPAEACPPIDEALLRRYVAWRNRDKRAIEP